MNTLNEEKPKHHTIINQNRKTIVKFMKNNDITNIKKFIFENNIKLKSFNVYNKFDFLIYAVGKNLSPSMVRYLYKKCHYKTINYKFILRRKNILTPLLLALIKSNYVLAEEILKNGGDINYKMIKYNILYCLYNYKSLTTKNVKFILNHGFNIDSINDHNLISKLNMDILQLILKRCIFDNAFILKLINIHVNKQTLSEEELNDLISSETNKIKVTDKWYQKALSNKRYKDIEEVYYYKDINYNKQELKELLLYLEMEYASLRIPDQYRLLKQVETQQIKIPMTKDDLDEQYNKLYVLLFKFLNYFIGYGKLRGLREFFRENEFVFKDIRYTEYDMITYAIKHDISNHCIKRILTYFPVSEIKDQWREIANEKKNRSVIKVIQKTLKY
ncbi:hypothetical protein BCR32DRAFT_247255 [Anaeromyces robustus]|uniref:Ankyrin n=1 Tax=Anaeromyces robustus TaxID=1754192 RepID=A0A1Y1WYD5_9FUNG|nr:hypothetical protein BCR32DRAFT_247255 [Anaeromyces robustus]|eukprot:ORX78338.1 hypothetical protein BCR32DRAFT_247255 [Anaeromyces robustus]